MSKIKNSNIRPDWWRHLTVSHMIRSHTTKYLPPASEGWKGNIFTLCVSPYGRARGGSHPVPMRGYSHRDLTGRRGYPHPSWPGQGYPGQVSMRYSHWDWMEYPPSGLDGGIPHQAGWVTPGRQSSTVSSCCVVCGMRSRRRTVTIPNGKAASK